MTVTNSLFQKRKLHTWISPSGKTKNQIDYILTRKSSTRLNILDSSTLNKPDISDHKIVRTKIRLNFTWPKKERRKPTIKTEQLKDKTKRQIFQLELRNRFSTLALINEPHEIYDNIVKAIHESAENSISDTIKSRVLKLYGHVKRSEEGLSRICLEGNVPGKCGKGRPRMIWLNNVCTWSGLTTKELRTGLLGERFPHVGAHSAKWR